MKTIGSFLLLAATALSGSAVASEVLNIPALPGFATSEFCMTSPKGGLMQPTSSIPPCVLEFPIPLSGSHTIKQISVYYGATNTGTIHVDANVRYKELKVSSAATIVDYDTGLAWSTNAGNISPSAVLSAGLMGQFGFPAVYPDAFVIGGNNAYYVRVSFTTVSSPSSNPEVFGLRILYD